MKGRRVIKGGVVSQHLHWSSHHVDSLDSGGGFGWARTSRPRVNSAIDVAGFLSQVFNPNGSQRGGDRGQISNSPNPRSENLRKERISRTDERIDRVSTLLFPLPRSIEIGNRSNEIFSIFGRYSGVWEASYVLKYVTRARKRAVYKIDRHVRNVKVQGSRRWGVVHGLIDKPLSFRSYRTYVVRIRSFPPPSSSQWTAIAITNATFFPSLLSPSPFFS